MSYGWELLHLNVNGPSGVGKTTICHRLAELYKVWWVPRYTCRPKIRGENVAEEYVFLERHKFLWLSHMLIKASIHERDFHKQKYFVGVPHPEHWQRPHPETELMVSIFGGYSPKLKRLFVPGMVNVWVDKRDKDALREQLKQKSRRKNLNFTEKMRWNALAEKLQVEKEYDHVVYNDGTIDECVAEIVKIMGLPPRLDPP